MKDVPSATLTRPVAAPAFTPLSSRRRDLRFVLVAYGLSRLCAFVGFLVAALFQPGGSIGRLPLMWDGGWYLRLVEEGYPSFLPEVGGRAVQSTLAFFPVFPMAIRLVSAVPGVSDGAAGLIVSLVSGGLASWVVFRLAERLAGPIVARRAALLFCFFPGSVVFSLVYAEGLMIALAGACLLALGRQRWVWAGALAGVAGLTRPNSVVLVAACGWAAGEAVLRRREWRALIAPMLAGAGTLAFFAFLWLRTGEIDAWFRVEHEGWHQKFDFGSSLVNALAWALRAPFGSAEPLIVATMFGIAVAGVWHLLHRRGWPPVVSVYVVGVLAMAATSQLDVMRPRAVLAAFPIFIAFGDRLSHRACTMLVGGFGIALLVMPWYWSLPFLSSSSP